MSATADGKVAELAGELDNGEPVLPDAPGFGIEVDHAALDRAARQARDAS